MVNALAQFMVSQGYDAKDTSTPTVFNSNLVAAFDKYIHGITDAIETTLTEAITKAQEDATKSLLQSASCYEHIISVKGEFANSAGVYNKIDLTDVDFSKFDSLLCFLCYDHTTSSYDQSTNPIVTVSLNTTNDNQTGLTICQVCFSEYSSFTGSSRRICIGMTLNDYNDNLTYSNFPQTSQTGYYYKQMKMSDVRFCYIKNVRNDSNSTSRKYTMHLYGLKKGS